MSIKIDKNGNYILDSPRVDLSKCNKIVKNKDLEWEAVEKPVPVARYCNPSSDRQETCCPTLGFVSKVYTGGKSKIDALHTK